ncbi:hypothetical protein OFN60_38780, partial [Escherichia coli]|nr:hypothetical protein [Escherichia coli]
GTLVAIVIGVAVAALYYSTSCVNLNKYAQSQTYAAAHLAPYAFVRSAYALGTTRVAVEPTRTEVATTLTYRKAAYEAGMANPA